MKKRLTPLLFFALSATTTASFAQSAIAEGPWRGVFHQANGTEVPFNFEVKGKTTATAKLYLVNGPERFAASGITVKGDSIFIAFDQFDNELAAKIEGKKLSGVLRKKDHSGRVTSVDATFGDAYRFATNGEEPAVDISGKYDVVFKGRNGTDEKKVGLFKQQGNKLTATFLSITGDSRYLEGVVQGHEFYLSSFIGSGASYYTGTFDEQGQITGTANGGAFNATKNAEAALPDPYKLTYLKDGYKTFDFALPDADGKTVSLKDDKFKNKVVILTIGGTWCPNCMDEAAFVAPWYQKNKNRGVEIVGLQFERKNDPVYVKTAMENFKKRFGVTYTELFGGVVDKKAVAESFPALNTFLSFPTILFIDKKGNVDKIYTGFTGPATGEYYTQFIKEFNEEVDQLLKKDAI
ncbi:peroxiredoxin family protein [Mucilaginibacter flavus]|uniref:peroxiredoxin family protein n=1 Tax=Mucilaginibacter flavus TaxID=931504 RepID=UPI0025B4B98E|nr:TlpA disulfide reductase family protein [Mucilaginibacter flavus]MDN3582053.1 TlpA disulfide reductase family protein [Mucilaginibacter flavus]